MKVKAWALTFLFILSIPALSRAQNYTDITGKEIYLGDEDIKSAGFHFISMAGQLDVEKPGFIGPGMEVTKVGGAYILSPKGTIIEDRGSWVKVEDLGSYLGRKFDSVEKRLEQIEENQRVILNELEQFRYALDELNERTMTSK